MTAITRAGSSAEVPAGVERRVVDYERPATVEEALRGQDVLVITMSVAAPDGQQEILLRAAAAAGIRWVLPNEWGIDHTDPEMGRDTMLGPKADAAAHLIEQLGVSTYIRFTCGFWYEYSLGSGEGTYGFDFRKQPRQFTLIDNGDTKINTSTFDQTGLACARLLALKILPDSADDKSPTLSRYANRTFYMASFTLSQRDMFESVKRVTQTSEADWQISRVNSKERFTEARTRLLAGDRMAFGRVLYTRVLYPDGSGDFGAKYGLQNAVVDLPTADLHTATQRGIDHAMTTKLQF